MLTLSEHTASVVITHHSPILPLSLSLSLSDTFTFQTKTRVNDPPRVSVSNINSSIKTRHPHVETQHERIKTPINTPLTFYLNQERISHTEPKTSTHKHNKKLKKPVNSISCCPQFKMPKTGPRNFFSKPSTPLSSPSPRRKTFSDAIIDENIETARSLITKWDPISTSNQSQSHSHSLYYTKTNPLFSNTRQEAKQYLNAVRRLQSAMQYLVTQDSSSEKLIQAQLLMQLAMKRLQTEFHRILSQNRDRLDAESLSVNSSTDRRSTISDYDDEFSNDDAPLADDSVSTSAMVDLKAIAECMMSAGYSKECVRIYVLVRKSIVDESLYNLGVELLSFSQVQKMDWEVLERKIRCWLNAVKFAIGTLFSNEKTLCDYVFDFPEKKVAESCFSEICKGSAMLLFGFPENVAKCKKTPEKIFRTLDLYEAISDNWQRIESIFSSDSTSPVKSQVILSQVKLGEAVRTMLSDFESAIQKESSKIPVPGGGLHPLTRYVINYITLLADYSGSLADIIADWPQNPLPESYYRSPYLEDNNHPPEVAERFAWLILVVLCKLDGKAAFYKDVALSYLFLANNMQYVVVKVRKSNLGFLLGDDWLLKHEAKVKEYVSKYERVAWSKVLSSLPENPTVEKAREIFESFNVEFQEACMVQYSWVVPDPNLRDEIKASIVSKLLPRYRELYEKYRVGLNSIIRFVPNDLGSYLSNILCGTGSVSSNSLDRFKGP